MERPIQKIIPSWDIDDAMNSALGNPGDYLNREEYIKMRKQLFKM